MNTIEHDNSIALHSGEYVEKYMRKSLDRIHNLVELMQIDENDELVDFACGDAMLLQAIGDRKGCYHGVDFSRDFISAAQQRATEGGFKNCHFHCQDIVKFCAEHPTQFDIATTLDFSEHVLDDVATDIYTSIRSTLRPGGRLYLHTPNLDFFLERAKDIGLISQFPEHIAVRNAEETRRILERAGFERSRINIRHIPHYNTLKYLHTMRTLPLVGKYFKARIWIEAIT